MTISSTQTRISYNGNGATTEFAFPYLFLAAADLEVRLVAADGAVTLLTLNTNYTVTGVGDDNGGEITLNVAPAAGQRLVINRVMNLVQEIDYITGDPFPAQTHERGLDRLTMMVQQHEERLDRTLQLPITSEANAALIDPEAVEVVAGIAGDVTAVALIDTEVTTVAGNNANVTTVAGISGNVTTVAGISSNVTSVAGNATNINTVATNIANVNATGANIANVNAVAGNATNINAVNANSTNINTVAGISNDVTTVAGIAGDVQAVENIASNVTAVAGNATNINAVAGNNSNITAVAGNATNINAVAGNATNINAVNANKTNIDTVAGNNSNITTVANNNANVTTVAGISANVTTVAGISADVTAVAGNNANVSTVAANIASVNTAASDIAAIIEVANDLNEAVSEIEVVANNIASVDTVGINIASVNAVAAIDSDVSIAAANVADITNFADVYQGPKAADPTARNDSSALQTGDLYFNTVADEMRVYTGTAWKATGSAVNGTAVRQTFTATAGQTSFTVTGGYDAGFADVYLNGVKLVNGVDVNVSSGTAVVLTVGAAAGDSVDVIAYGAFVLANHYTQAQVDSLLAGKVNRAGDTMTGQLQVLVNDTDLKRVKTFAGVGTTYNGAAAGTPDKIVSGVDIDWYSDTWRVGATRGDGSDIQELMFVRNGVKHMGVDGSGRVTMPNQPAFQVVGAASGSYTPGTQIPFTDSAAAYVVFNTGGHWSNASDRFTAPVAGKYLFYAAIYYQNGNSTFGAIAPRVNGSQINAGDSFILFDGGTVNLGSGDNQLKGTFVLNLAANDYVDLAIRNAGGATLTIYSGHSFFGGHLIS